MPAVAGGVGAVGVGVDREHLREAVGSLGGGVDVELAEAGPDLHLLGQRHPLVTEEQHAPLGDQLTELREAVFVELLQLDPFELGADRLGQIGTGVRG